MKHLGTTIICLGILTACTDNEASIEEKYILQEIQYQLEAGDGSELTERPLPIQQYINYSNEPVSVTLSTGKDLYEYSQFSSTQPDAFWETEVENAELVPVPGLIDKGVIYMSQDKKPFISQRYERLTPTFHESTTMVDPNCSYSLRGTVTFRKTQATYTARFRGRYTGTEKTVKGKWQGSVVTNTVPEFIIETLP